MAVWACEGYWINSFFHKSPENAEKRRSVFPKDEEVVLKCLESLESENLDFFSQKRLAIDRAADGRMDVMPTFHYSFNVCVCRI